MKATIIYFSPCGSTKKVANFIEAEFLEYGWNVQMLNMTKDKDLFPETNYEKFINRIEKHDLLLVGGPIYIDHLHYNIINLIKALPQADEEIFSRNAGIFTTFGKITPGVGSAEAAIALRNSGRQTLAAIEVDSEHCVSRNIDFPISKGLPGDEVIGLVEDYVKFLIGIAEGKEGPEEDLVSRLGKRFDDFLHLADERLVTDKSFPDIKFNYDLCEQCYLCVEGCPVNYLVIKDGYPTTLSQDICVHCTNCLYNCPAGAVIMDLYDKEPFYRKQLQDHNLKPDGPSISKFIK